MTQSMVSFKNKNSLKNQLLYCCQNQFTGRLEVAGTDRTWSFFFCLGRLIWATGGRHSNRRFYRLWHQFFPEVSLRRIELRQEDFVVCYNYQIMAILSIRKKLSPEKTAQIAMETLKEIIFDIFQAEEKETLVYTRDSSGAIDTSLTLMSASVRPQEILPQVELLWSDWKISGLAALSPNFVPVMKKLEELKKVTSPKVYQTLVKAIDGERTFRSLAILIKQDLRKLTLYLIPYLRKGIISLKVLPDRGKLKLAAEGTPTPISARSPKSIPRAKTVTSTFEPTIKATIVCVDDSPLICRQMQSILEKAGYKFIGIQDSIKALPALIETKPDLIFLDLVMPVANGYEICTQIRRVSGLKETPVIILTGKDGIVDRVRAKVVGSSGFMAKPVNTEKVLAAVKKYLEPSSPEPQKLTPRTLGVQIS